MRFFKKPTVSVVAIDGTSQFTQPYLTLLEQQRALTRADAALFLTSDVRASSTPSTTAKAIPRLDRMEYSRFCVEQLAQHVTTDFALCVQLDGFVVNPHRWRSEFWKYDFIGAPWLSHPSRPLPENRRVGNGGFSWRSKRYLEATAKLRWHGDWAAEPIGQAAWGHEDYFCNVMRREVLESQGVRFAPIETARKFSIQEGQRHGPQHLLRNVFGFHGRMFIEPALARLEHHARRARFNFFPEVRRRWARVHETLPKLASEHPQTWAAI